jgi:hypothetical protein
MVGALVAELAFGADITDPDDYGRLTPAIEDHIRDVLADLGVPRPRHRADLPDVPGAAAARRPAGPALLLRAFVHKNYFPEALQFFTLAVEVMGRHEDALEVV